MDIHLRDGHVLCAYCKRPSGEATYSELDLDRFLGVKKGKQWTPIPARILELSILNQTNTRLHRQIRMGRP